VPGGWLMVYAGHAYDVGAKTGNRLLAATSPDGLTWTKEATPILEASPAQAWRSDGVAEPDLVPGPDGRWYLFFTGLQGERRVIGVASGPTPRGPWEVDPDPIVVPRATFEDKGVLAPSILIEGDRVRMWYLAHGSPDYFVVGYAEAAWPLRQPHASAAGPRPAAHPALAAARP
jgi:hypothetical protein